MLDRWTRVAGSLRWDTPWRTLCEGEGPDRRWFTGGELNAATNCLDRHLGERSATVAMHWEGEPGDRRTLTYGELHAETCAFARALRALGIGPGDRVALYVGAVPELFVAMLACARIGAVTSLLPASLPVVAVAERLAAFSPKMVLTQDGAWRHGVVIPLKARADEALEAIGSIERVAVVRRTGIDVPWYDDDLWYHDLVAPAAGLPGAQGSRAPGAPRTADDRAVPLPADHPLIVHYLPGLDAPSPVVHRTAGVMVMAAAMHRLVFAPGADDVFWPALEVAYAGGTTHGVLGPLACGATSVIFEGMLDTPTTDRTWQIIKRYGVTSTLTVPSILRRLERWWGRDLPVEALTSMRRVVTLGEPLEPTERRWLAAAVGGRDLVVLDGWGQTELGGAVAFTPDPEEAGRLPDPGLDVVDETGQSVPVGSTGELVLRHPWPATFLDPEADPGRYWMTIDDTVVYRSGDLARREAGGALTVLERLDPMVKVSGQLVSLASVADVLCQHPLVEAAEVIQTPGREGDRLLVAWVVPTADASPGPELAADLQHDLHDMLGGLSVPHTVAFVDAFPPELGPGDRRAALRRLAFPERAPLVIVSVEELRKTASTSGG